MVKSVNRRIKKFEANTNPERLALNLKALKPNMVKSQSGYFSEMAKIEQDAKILLEEIGTSPFQIPNYLFFAREIYRIRKTFGKLTLSSSGQERLLKWRNRGLNENLLIKVAAQQGVVLFNLPVPPVPPVLTGNALITDVLKDKTFYNTDAALKLIGTLEILLSGNADLGDVLKSKTFYKDDYLSKLIGTLELTANAEIEDVLKDLTFYKDDAKTKKTGTLELTGDAALDDVLLNKTFYNTLAKNKRTGTLELTGNALVTDVYEGKTFYRTDPKTRLTGTLPIPPTPPASDIFGDQTAYTGLGDILGSQLWCHIYYPAWNGNASSISARVQSNPNLATYSIKCALYYTNPPTKLDETTILTQAIPTSPTVITCSFASPPSIIKNRCYFITIGGTVSGGNSCNVLDAFDIPNRAYRGSYTPNTMPASLPALTISYYKHAIYCTYTPTS